jgi:hypothetical protein
MIRKVAYERTVRAYYDIKHKKTAAEEALNYLLDFPGEKDKTSYIGQTIRLYLAKAVYEMLPSDYEDIKTRVSDDKNQKKDNVSIKILEEIVAENGPRSWAAREELRKIGTGWFKYIVDGLAQYHEKDYKKAISSLQKGINDAPKDLPIEKQLTDLAQAWYYLGFSYFHRDMKLPSVICFKEGTTRFMKVYKDKRDTLPQAQKQWFLENRKNWKTIAGLYYRDTRSKLAIDIFKEALLAYAQVQGEQGEEDVGRNTDVHVNLAIIMAQNEEYKEALEELEKVGADSPSFAKSIRLKAKFYWAMYDAEKRKDKELVKKAFKLSNDFKSILKEQLAKATDDVEEKKYLNNQLAEMDAFIISMFYFEKNYKEIIKGIDQFWKNPPADKEMAFRTGRYQIYACVLMEVDESKYEQLKVKMDNLFMAKKLLNTLKAKYPGHDEDIHKTVKTIGFSFFNISRKLGVLNKAEDEKKCLNESGEMLYEFIMNAGEAVDESYLIAVADILYKRLKDYARSEEVTRRILEIFKARVGDHYPPYDKATQDKLAAMAEKLFDRNEARDRWALMIDRMYDGKGKKSQEQLSRKDFKTIKREFWGEHIGEKPYMYEEAYKWLSEAVMYELGYTEKKKKELAAKRDSDDSRNSEAFWKDLFEDYNKTYHKDPKDLKELHAFLENTIFVNNYKERLGECYLHTEKFDKALNLFKELDDYYIFEPSTKRRVGSILIDMARKSDDDAKKKALAEEAKQIFLWIKVHAPADLEAGRIEHFEAVLRIAECYEVEGSLEAAIRTLKSEIDYGTYQFPRTGNYKEKMKKLIKEYETKKKNAPKETKPVEKKEEIKEEKKEEKPERKPEKDVKDDSKEKAGVKK